MEQINQTEVALLFLSAGENKNKNPMTLKFFHNSYFLQNLSSEYSLEVTHYYLIYGPECGRSPLYILNKFHILLHIVRCGTIPLHGFTVIPKTL